MAFVPVPNTYIDVWFNSDPFTDPPDIVANAVQQVKPYIEYTGEIVDPAYRNFIYRLFSPGDELAQVIGCGIRPGFQSAFFRFSSFNPGAIFEITGIQVYLDGGEIVYSYITAIIHSTQAP